MSDLRLAFRQLIRNKGFSLTVLLTLALSIGANTAVFSVVNALLIRPLPYPQPDRLGTILGRITGRGDTDEVSGVDGEKWELLRDNVPSAIAAVQSDVVAGVNLQAGSSARYVHAGRVSAHYFEVLGITPKFGRSFTEEEDREGGPKSAILSDALWRTALGGDPRVVGSTLLLKGEPYTVVGILPPNTVTPQNADVFTPVRVTRKGEGVGNNFTEILRLRPGATWHRVDSEVEQAWHSRATRFEKANPGSHIRYYTVPLQKAVSEPLHGPVLALMWAVSFILMIACANLAGLMLVRIGRRSPEFATRLALGASRWNLLRQLWVESIVLASMGGFVGICTGALALRGLHAFVPPNLLPVQNIGLDGRVLGFAILATLGTSLLFGLMPALQTRRLDLRSSIAAGATRGSMADIRIRQGLICAEVAVTVVLLAASGLLIRTLAYLETLPPGFDSTDVMTAKLSLDDQRYHGPNNFRNLVGSSLEAMRRIPGVKSAAMGLNLPYERGLNDGVKIADGKEAGEERTSTVIYVSPGYFETLRMRVLAGRTFTESDGPDTQRVAVVNESFARRYLHQPDATGRHLGAENTTDKDNMVVVGVVGDVTATPGFDNNQPLASEPTVYIPASQVNSNVLAIVHTWFQPSWIVRTTGPVYGLTEQMQTALASADPSLPFSGFYRMSDLRAQAVALQRVEVTLLSVLASLALLLSAIGIFGLVSNMVVQRTREIGIRIALGSSLRRAMANVGRSGLVAAGTGLLTGLVLSVFVLRATRSAIFGVHVYDPATIVSVVALLAAVIGVAVFVPTFRIARIDPAQTLRAE